MASRFSSRLVPLFALLTGLALMEACGTSKESNPSGSGSSSGAGGASQGACPPCVSTSDCGKGSVCGQFSGDTFCAPDCSSGQACASGRSCLVLSSTEGMPVSLCIPNTDVCGSVLSSGVSSTGSGAGGGAPMVCGNLDGPTVTACCSSCTQAGKPCQANGCYNGYWCNKDLCKCQPAPVGACGASSSSSSSSGGGGGSPGGMVGPGGGTLTTLSFAIVGDTRPAMINDTAGYPSAVIGKIWSDIEAQNPRPPFAVTTGDYMFSYSNGGQAAPQLDLYLAARAAFSNVTFPAMGNHECTGATASNCGQGNVDGVPDNYKQFLAKLLAPLGIQSPYYTINIKAADNSWTAKFVFIAANAWSSAQATWLSQELAAPTTYTFIVRHERSDVTQAPGVSPSNAIITAHPFTILVVGHTHTYYYDSFGKQIIVGNGGAPLTGGVNYGYVIAAQRPDGAIQFTERDYATNAANQTFAVKADGTPTP